VTPLELLDTGEITVEGRVVAASNLTLYARVDAPDGQTMPCVYKPVSGERPLWDFPDGTLAARERVAFLVSEAGGWHLVPPTVLREGPLGVGMCQQWVTRDDSNAPPGDRLDWVDLLDGDSAQPAGWLPVVRGQDETGRSVMLVHRDDAALRAMALLDAVLNNADRKAGHLLTGTGGALYGVDHGLCCHEEPKLRTVLWGWRGQSLTAAEQDRLERVGTWLAAPDAELEVLLTTAEVDAMRARVHDLQRSARLPGPSGSWPAIPWPAF
jgi:uncharacterized repeat protein (TIGR03843 family)